MGEQALECTGRSLSSACFTNGLQNFVNLVSNALKFTERGVILMSGKPTNATLWLERIGKSGNLEEAGKSYQVLEKAIELLRLQLVCLKEETV